MVNPTESFLPATQTASDWLSTVRRYERNGEFFKAYDLALHGLAEHPDDIWLAHRAVLCLANAGALALARRRFDDWQLAASREMDVIALDGRLLKDEALQLDGETRRQGLLAAARRYRQAYEHALATGRGDAYYPGINLASLCLLAGDAGTATTIANEVLDGLRKYDGEGRADGYWRQATALEAMLIVGRYDEAHALAMDVIQAGQQQPVDLASTARQLRRIASALALDEAWLSEFSAPRVIHYTGHMIGQAGSPRRLAASDEPAMRDAVAARFDEMRIGSAYGSLACGADILFAEALLDRGVSLNVVLPFQTEEFIAQSVAPGGVAWVARFERCLAQAATVRFATEDQYLGDDQLFSYGSQLAMGMAMVCARHLHTQAVQFAIWDGQLPEREGGTASDLITWRRCGLQQEIIRCGALPSKPLPLDVAAPINEQGRQGRAMLFGDVKGFSKLNDRQIASYVDSVLSAIATVIDRFRGAIAYANTWGDGLFLVFDIQAAAECAVALQASVSSVDLAELGLPLDLALRVGGHFGPVYAITDPVIQRESYMGTHVNRAARIEPITPEGCIYVTENFAALLALKHRSDYVCDYVGVTETAKRFGALRMFLLRRAGSSNDGPPTLRSL